MAVRGLSLAERQEFILDSDPAKPENIEAEIARRTKHVTDSDQISKIKDSVYQEAGDPTIFYLGNLLQEDRVFLGDLSGGLEQTPQGNMRMVMRNTHKLYETVRRGLVGWHNFLDGGGKAVSFEEEPSTTERGQPRRVASQTSMSYLSMDMLRELGHEILRINGVTSELEKKFSAQLQESEEAHSPGGPVTNALSARSETVDAGTGVPEETTGSYPKASGKTPARSTG